LPFDQLNINRREKKKGVDIKNTNRYIFVMSDAGLSKAERTRRFIIEKSSPIFNKKGYAGTSLSDLTQATGLTKGSIYGNFKNKDEVAVCAFHHNLAFMIESLTSEIDKSRNYVEKLLAYPRVYRRNIKAMIAIGGCPILNTVIDADNTNDTLRSLAVDTIVDWKRAIIKLVSKGKTAGELKPDTDEAVVAENIISLIEGGNAMTKATGEESYILNAIGQTESIIYSIVR
jgi:TetR/AcrR family transcriptional repressor of nem operon